MSCAMRTVITHFFNEQYLLPWWLDHHLKIFDHGILIDHGSTDNSADICRQLAPHWRLVKSSLSSFDAWLTDFEVMNYEKEISGWKIALTTTEFLVSNPSLDELERYLQAEKKSGISASGMTMVDKAPFELPSQGLSLVEQKPWAIDDNRFGKMKWLRQLLGYPKTPHRNRFYHCLPTGMYAPGRHWTFHPDSAIRTPNLKVLHYAYSPWNDQFIQRKKQIGGKLSDADVRIGVGFQHLRNTDQLHKAFKRFDRLQHLNMMQHLFQIPVANSTPRLNSGDIIELPNPIRRG